MLKTVTKLTRKIIFDKTDNGLDKPLFQYCANMLKDRPKDKQLTIDKVYIFMSYQNEASQLAYEELLE